MGRCPGVAPSWYETAPLALTDSSHNLIEDNGVTKDSSQGVGGLNAFDFGDEVPSSALALEELCHGFGAGPDLEFFVNPADIRVNGFVADSEFLSNLLIEKALTQALEHFLLALR